MDWVAFGFSSSCFLPNFQKSRFRGFALPDSLSVEGNGVLGSCVALLNKGALEFLDSALASPSSSRFTGDRVDMVSVELLFTSTENSNGVTIKVQGN